MDGLEIWIKKPGFDFVHIEEFSKTFEQGNYMLEKYYSRTT